MNLVRFSLLSLVLLVLAAAFAFAALRSMSDVWASAAFTLSLAFLCVATLMTIFQEGGRRAFWTGCAVVGWIYSLVAFSPFFKSESPELLTGRFLQYVYSKLPPEIQLPPAARQQLGEGPLGQSMHTMYPGLGGVSAEFTVNIRRPFPQEQFRRVGHSLFSLMFALLGGICGRWLYQRQQARAVSQPAAPKSSGL